MLQQKETGEVNYSTELILELTLSEVTCHGHIAEELRSQSSFFYSKAFA